MARRIRVLERSTLKTSNASNAAHRPRAKGDLADVQAGQSPISPIPMGRAISRSTKIERTERTTFTTSAYPLSPSPSGAGQKIEADTRNRRLTIRKSFVIIRKVFVTDG